MTKAYKAARGRKTKTEAEEENVKAQGAVAKGANAELVEELSQLKAIMEAWTPPPPHGSKKKEEPGRSQSSSEKIQEDPAMAVEEKVTLEETAPNPKRSL